MWHLKDWILNDEAFQAKDRKIISDDIHSNQCLMVCADIANRSKHFKLKSSKTQTSEFTEAGLLLSPQKGIFQQYYWIISDNKNSIYHKMEIRHFLNECWEEWTDIIGKHNLSAYDI